MEDPALAGLRLSAAGLAGRAAHPPLRGSATKTLAHPRHPQTDNVPVATSATSGWSPKAKTRTCERGDSKGACVGLGRAAAVVRSIPRWRLPSRFASARGALLVRTSRPQEPAFGRAGKSASLAPLIFRGVAGCPRRRGSRRQRSGFGSGEGFPLPIQNRACPSKLYGSTHG